MRTGDKLVVGGTFKTYAGFLRNSLLRLNLAPETPIRNGKILFVSNRDGNQEIYTMNPDGTNQQRLTNSAENEHIANWSPDGSKILYRKIISSTQTSLWTMNSNGSNQTLISEANGVRSIIRMVARRNKKFYLLKRIVLDCRKSLDDERRRHKSRYT